MFIKEASLRGQGAARCVNAVQNLDSYSIRAQGRRVFHLHFGQCGHGTSETIERVLYSETSRFLLTTTRIATSVSHPHTLKISRN
jgi:hypothetical protein